MLIGIDPGPKKGAYVLWTGEKVRECGILPNAELREYLKDKLTPSSSIEVAVEEIRFMGQKVGAEVFDTCFEIGRIIEIVATTDREVILVPRNHAKIHLCRTMRVKDKHIRAALIEKWGPVGTKKLKGPLFGVKSHIWSALAIADTAWPIAEARYECWYEHTKSWRPN
jgi:hypothetical protein